MTPRNFGFGLTGVNDKIGPLSIGRIDIDLAYHLPINNAFLAIGIKTGVTNFDFDENLIQTTDPDDLAFAFDEEGKFIPNIGFGIYYNHSKWYVGLSIPSFIENEDLNLQRHYYGILGGLINITDYFNIKPSMLIKSTASSDLGYDLSALLIYKDLFWIGPQTRSSLKKGLPSTAFGGGFGIIAGIHFNKTISIGYSYNTSSLGKLISVNHATHEIMLRFNLIPTVKTMLRSPRIF